MCPLSLVLHPSLHPIPPSLHPSISPFSSLYQKESKGPISVLVPVPVPAPVPVLGLLESPTGVFPFASLQPLTSPYSSFHPQTISFGPQTQLFCTFFPSFLFHNSVILQDLLHSTGPGTLHRISHGHAICCRTTLCSLAANSRPEVRLSVATGVGSRGLTRESRVWCRVSLQHPPQLCSPIGLLRHDGHFQEKGLQVLI